MTDYATMPNCELDAAAGKMMGWTPKPNSKWWWAGRLPIMGIDDWHPSTSADDDCRVLEWARQSFDMEEMTTMYDAYWSLVASRAGNNIEFAACIDALLYERGDWTRAALVVDEERGIKRGKDGAP